MPSRCCTSTCIHLATTLASLRTPRWRTPRWRREQGSPRYFLGCLISETQENSVSRAKRHRWKMWPFLARAKRLTLKIARFCLFPHACFRTELCVLFVLLRHRNKLEPQNHTAVASASHMQKSMTRTAKSGLRLR